MIFTYNKATTEINLPKITTFKDQNILERQDIEKWIEENPDILGEELLIVSTEYDRFDQTNERLDLLAIDKRGNLVVVELKRDDSGKDVDMQAIKYAAYCSTLTFKDLILLYKEYLNKKSQDLEIDKVRELLLDFIEDEEFEELNEKPRIIIASKDFRQEVTASILWLRKFGIDITCIKLTPYEIDENLLVIESNVIIPLPEAKDYLINVEKKENVEYKKSVTTNEYFEFYKDLRDKVKDQLYTCIFTEPAGINYYQIKPNANISKVHFEWGFHGRPRSSFELGLHFETSKKELNEEYCEKLSLFKDELERKTSEKVIIEKSWKESRGWSRIYILKNEGKVTEELKDWAVKNMKIFYDIFSKEIEALKK